jgi:hypothetical protein
LTGILWIDDCQLVDVTMRKLIASGDEQAHCEVALWAMQEAMER